MYEVSHLLRIRLLTMVDIKLFHGKLIFDQTEVELVDEVKKWIEYVRNNIYLCRSYKTTSGPYIGIFPTSVVIDDPDSKVVVDFCMDTINMMYNSYRDWF